MNLRTLQLNINGSGMLVPEGVADFFWQPLHNPVRVPVGSARLSDYCKYSNLVLSQVKMISDPNYLVHALYER